METRHNNVAVAKTNIRVFDNREIIDS